MRVRHSTPESVNEVGVVLAVVIVVVVVVVVAVAAEVVVVVVVVKAAFIKVLFVVSCEPVL